MKKYARQLLCFCLILSVSVVFLLIFPGGDEPLPDTPEEQSAPEVPIKEAPETAPPKEEIAVMQVTPEEPKPEPVYEAAPDTVSVPDEPAQERLDPAHFFDDAVFIGDSVTLGLKNYVVACRNGGEECLGTAQFLPAGSMGYTNSLPPVGTDNSIHPVFQGAEVTIEEGVSLTGAKKVFILLGMNDFAIYPVGTCMDRVAQCVERILEVNPEVSVYLQSVTPTTRARGSFNNENIDVFNTSLSELCGEKGWTFVDIASAMKDESGKLRDEYCSDPQDLGVHMTAEGARVWIARLHELLTAPYEEE